MAPYPRIETALAHELLRHKGRSSEEDRLLNRSGKKTGNDH